MELLMQLDIGMSIKRYIPPSGTAGLDRIEVSGANRVPRPPPKTIATTFFIVPFSFLNDP
jgi:hypothetical protein